MGFLTGDGGCEDKGVPLRAVLSQREQVAEGTVRFDFDLGDATLDFQPGQFFNIDLVDPLYTDERGSHRHFTILNSPHLAHRVSLATRMRDSAFKRSLRDMPLGSPVEIGDVGGNFTLPAGTSQPLVFLAGGIGITPFFCMSTFIMEECSPHQVTLLYSNRNRASAAFLSQLQSYDAQSPSFHLVAIMTDDEGWEGESRRLDAEVIKAHVADLTTCFFMMAGPQAMNEALSAELVSLGIPREQVKADHFLGY